MFYINYSVIRRLGSSDYLIRRNVEHPDVNAPKIMMSLCRISKHTHIHSPLSACFLILEENPSSSQYLEDLYSSRSMATVYFLMEGLLVLGLTLTLWHYLRLRLVKSPLDAIPGPPATSFLQGDQRSLSFVLPGVLYLTLSLGNMSEYFSRHGAEFQERVAQDYGPVVKLHGYLGVSTGSSADLRPAHIEFLFRKKSYMSGIIKHSIIFSLGRRISSRNRTSSYGVSLCSDVCYVLTRVPLTGSIITCSAQVSWPL